jgi:methylaspartate mutase epsilon subunit
MLMAAGQGVRHYSMGLCQSLNILQDVAGLRALKEVGRDYLKRFGCADVFFSIASHQWMQAFPNDEPRAYAVIVLGGVIAALSGATQIITKSTHEAEGIPTKEANAQGIKATRMAIELIRSNRFPESTELLQEKRMIIREACSILDKALEMGDGDPVLASLRSLQAGVLDIPWAPNQFVAGKIIPVRDASGAVRYLDHANLPFDPEILEYNREKIRERERRDGKKADYEAAIFDVTEISKMLEGA